MLIGETLQVRAKAATVAGKVIEEGMAVARFWPPGRPTADTAAFEIPLRFDGRARCWQADVETDGWMPGRWTVRATVRSVQATGMSTFQFVLDAT